MTAAHTPLFWRYDLDSETNPFLMERFGINAVFLTRELSNGTANMLCVLGWKEWIEKSFFAMAESPNGVDNFTFWDYPCTIPETENPDTNVYDMRLVKHMKMDGFMAYFCTERKDPSVSASDTSSAVAQCGIVRTKDLIHFERLPDLKTPSSQQRQCGLAPRICEWSIRPLHPPTRRFY